MKYYPAFIDLQGKKTVVVGGGTVAERKVSSLLDAGAGVTVISPRLTRRLLQWKHQGKIRHKARGFRAGDLKGCFLAIAATSDPVVNGKVSAEAQCPVNVVDVPSLCSFIVPAVVKRGPLRIAISTGGVSPALAKTIRHELEAVYGREFDAYLKAVRVLRARALKDISSLSDRARFLRWIGSPEVLRMLRSEGYGAVKRAADNRIARYATGKDFRTRRQSPAGKISS